MVTRATFEMAGLRVSGSHLTTESDISVTVDTGWSAQLQDTVVKRGSGKVIHQHVNVSCYCI